MAIDTAEKRRAAAGVRRGPRVTPNASADAEWRAQAARSYRIEGGGPPGDEAAIGEPYLLLTVGQLLNNF